jgi:hypothetical protein
VLASRSPSVSTQGRTYHSQSFFCDIQFHCEPTHQAFQLGDPLLFGAAPLVFEQDQRSAFEKFGLPTSQYLRGELMLPTQSGSTERSTHQNKHLLCLTFRCKCSSLFHGDPLLDSSIHSGFHFARCPILGGHST